MNDSDVGNSFTPDSISEWFWDIIDQATHDRKKLRQILEGMNREDIIRFKYEFEEAATQLVGEPFINHMEEGTSEDGAQDIAEWVVSQGHAFYANVWHNPERVPNSLDENQQSTSLSSVVDDVYWERYREVIPRIDR
jgi:hypothetical protein